MRAPAGSSSPHVRLPVKPKPLQSKSTGRVASSGMAFERQSHRVASLMHGFSVLINFACSKVYFFVTKPAERNASCDRLRSPGREFNPIAQETDGRGGGLCTGYQKYTDK